MRHPAAKRAAFQDKMAVVMRSVLVTGGGGFIGRRIVAGLVEQGVRCIATVRSMMPAPSDAVRYVRCDLADPAVSSVLADVVEDVDTIFHVAGRIPQPGPALDPMSGFVADNILATTNLLDAVARGLVEGRRTVTSIVFTSTLDVYGMPETVPVSEDASTRPVTCYAATKLCAERLLQMFEARHEVPVAILRLSHIYGPGEPVIKAIPLFIRSAIRGDAPVISGEGEDVRDYLYVDDVAHAALNAGARRVSGTFNVSAGHGCTIREAAEEIIRAVGLPLTPVRRPRTQPPTTIILNNERAKAALAWRPAVSLVEGLRRHVEHARREEPR